MVNIYVLYRATDASATLTAQKYDETSILASVFNENKTPKCAIEKKLFLTSQCDSI